MPAYNTDTQNAEFWKLKINKETDTPYFMRVEKKGDAWVETDAFTAMKGQLTAIELKTYTWEGKEKQSNFHKLNQSKIKKVKQFLSTTPIVMLFLNKLLKMK